MCTRWRRSSRTSAARPRARAPRCRAAADASPAISRSRATGRRSRRRPHTTSCTRTRCITSSSPRMPASTAARLLDSPRVPALDRGLDPDSAIDRVAASGLRGRGGAGFSLAEKLRAVRTNAAGQETYVVANAYDADPDSPLARTLLERHVELVVRGIELAMVITGATHAFLYLHPAATGARGAAESMLAGRDDIEITLGPGGFMGGEESALLNVLESNRAMARQRPPYPALQGYQMRPTLVSSAETLAWLPFVLDGAKADTKLVSVT